MTVIDRYDEFARIEAQYPRRIGSDNLMPAELRIKFNSGLVAVYADDKGLFIFERREGFHKLHFRIAGTDAVLPEHDGILAAYLTYREGRYPSDAANWLRAQGFTKKKTIIRHTAIQLNGNVSSEGIVTATADEVYSMFGEYFSEIETDFPSRGQFIETDTYCLRSAGGEPLGIFYDMGRTRIIAVSQRARKQGIGRRLYLGFAAAKLRENGNFVFHAWINPENTPSLALFHSMGFTQDDTMTDCFVRRK